MSLRARLLALVRVGALCIQLRQDASQSGLGPRWPERPIQKSQD